MEIKTADVINAAVAKALGEIDTDQLAAVLAGHLNEKAEKGYGKSDKTRLEEMVDSVTRQIAQDVIREVVESHRDEMRAQIVELLKGRHVTVTVDTGYQNKIDFTIEL